MPYADNDILPAELLAQYAYCPRRAHLIRAHGEWDDNVFIEEGRAVHRRVMGAEGERADLPTRSLTLEDPELGLRGVVDVLERWGGTVYPVEYKRGKKPPTPDHTQASVRVQLAAQALLLRARGYRVMEGVVYFAGSRDRVRVRITPELVERTLTIADALRQALASPCPPPPLQDSPKCPNCSLVTVCLPEETNFLRAGGQVRPLAVAEPQRFPMVVQRPGATVNLEGQRLVVREGGEASDAVGLETISQLVLMGSVHISTPALRECLNRLIPVVLLSGAGWFYGYARGLTHRNSALRLRQYAAAGDPQLRQTVINTLIANKIANCRTLLRRNGRPPARVLADLADLVRRARAAQTTEELAAHEGHAARLYFQHFSSMLKGTERVPFDFASRTRRPPTDPVNALLSFLYTLLVKDFTIVAETVGFDPFLGFLHTPRHGKPALALDLMEPFRPLIADSVAITLLNTREVGPADFFEREGAYLLIPAARRAAVAAYQRRLATEVHHPDFGYRVSYRRLLEIQTRLLARYLLQEIPRPPEFVVR